MPGNFQRTDRSTNFRREMEMLVGSLDGMAAANDMAAAVAVLHLNKILTRIKQGDWQNVHLQELLMRKIYAVELKVDFDDKSRHRLMLQIARKMGRLLLTQAALLADNRQPQVAITCDDFFEGGSVEALQDLPEDTSEEEQGDQVVSEQE